MVEARFREAEQRETYGLVDGGHIILKCSNCRKELVDILITRPHETSRWNVVAKCCFCGDRSKFTEVRGGFAYLHVEGKTSIVDVAYDDDKVVFHTEKVLHAN